jgi:hypothetical protein
MARRSGLPTVRDACQFLCAFIGATLPAIKKVFPDEEELHAQLELVRSVCCALVLLADDVIPKGD